MLRPCGIQVEDRSDAPNASVKVFKKNTADVTEIHRQPSLSGYALKQFPVTFFRHGSMGDCHTCMREKKGEIRKYTAVSG